MDLEVAKLKEEIYLISLDIKDKYYQKAIHKINDLIKVYPDRAEPYYELGRLCYDNWQNAEAELNYKTALEKDAQYFPSYREYAFLLIKTGRYDEAIAVIEKAFVLPNKEISDIYFYLGLAHQHKGELDEAMSNFKQSLQFSANENQIKSARNFLENCIEIKDKYLYL